MSDDTPGPIASFATLIISEPRFELGRLVITTGALDTLDASDVCYSVRRHAKAEWGDLCPEDARENERSLAGEGRLFSAYKDRKRTKFYVITEADRSATTVLLPEEY